MVTPTHPLLISKGAKPRKGKVIICKVCGTEVYRRLSLSIASKYCSLTCHNSDQKKNNPLKCSHCEKEYYRAPSQVKWRGTKYCSRKCKGEAQKANYQGLRFDKYKNPKSLKTFKKRVWDAFSAYIRERDEWTCFTCGKIAKGSSMHAGHFIPQTYTATLFDEMNVNAQCYRCNIWKRGNAGEYASRLIVKHGQEKFDALIAKSRQMHKFTFPELEQLYQAYSKWR